MRPFPACLAALSFAGLLFAASAAHAEGPTSRDYEKRDTPAHYTAPIYQTTQPSYVPQSVAMSGPREIKDWREGEAVPPGYRPVERTRRGLIIAGAVTFGSLYLISALVAAGGQDSHPGESNPLAAMWIPGVGPFVQMASTESATANVVLAIDGAAQSAGLVMLIYGLAVPRTVLVRNDLAKNERPAAPRPQVRAVPMVGGGTTGFGVVGTF